MQAPIPREPPVTIATLPSSLMPCLPWFAAATIAWAAPPTSPRPSPPQGGEGEKVGDACVPPPLCRAAGPERATARRAEWRVSQANGVSARRLREMNESGGGQGEAGLSKLLSGNHYSLSTTPQGRA